MKKNEIDSTLNEQAVKFAASHDLPKLNGEWIDATTTILKALPEELETGRYHEVKKTAVEVVDGHKREVIDTTREPVMRPFEAFSEMMKAKALDYLQKAYIEKPVPQLEFSRRPDTRKWLEALKYLFPNVKDVKQTMVSTQHFLKSRNNDYD